MSLVQFPELYIGGSWRRQDNQDLYTFFTEMADENNFYNLLVINPQNKKILELKFEIKEEENNTLLDIKGSTITPIITHDKNSFVLLIDNKINGITFIRELNPQIVN